MLLEKQFIGSLCALHTLFDHLTGLEPTSGANLEVG